MIFFVPYCSTPGVPFTNNNIYMGETDLGLSGFKSGYLEIDTSIRPGVATLLRDI